MFVIGFTRFIKRSSQNYRIMLKDPSFHVVLSTIESRLVLLPP